MLNFKKRKKTNPDASHLLATILVVYPIVSTVSYEPKDGLIQLSFAMKGAPTQESFKEFAQQLVDSMEAYHQLEGFSNARIEMYMEGVGETFFLHLKRDLATLSRGELSLLTTLIDERFADDLIMDGAHEIMDLDFLLAQEDHLDQMLSMARQMQIPDRLVGIREHERVVVYTR